MAASTFGLEEPPSWLPTYTADFAVTSFLQGSTLLFGAALSLVLTRRLGGVPWRLLLPQCGLIFLFTAELWELIVR